MHGEPPNDDDDFYTLNDHVHEYEITINRG